MPARVSAHIPDRVLLCTHQKSEAGAREPGMCQMRVLRSRAGSRQARSSATSTSEQQNRCQGTFLITLTFQSDRLKPVIFPSFFFFCPRLLCIRTESSGSRRRCQLLWGTGLRSQPCLITHSSLLSHRVLVANDSFLIGVTCLSICTVELTRVTVW